MQFNHPVVTGCLFISICIRRSVRLLFLRLGIHLLIIRPYKYNLELICVMRLLFGTSLAKVVRLRAEIGCSGQTDRHYENLYIDYYCSITAGTITTPISAFAASAG